MEDPQPVDPAPPEEFAETDIAQLLDEVTIKDLASAKKDKAFRAATAQLLAGEMRVPEWEWYAVRAINRKVNIPMLSEAVERGIFSKVFDVLGTALEGFLIGGSGSFDEVTNDGRFRQAVTALLTGEMGVPEFVDVAGEVLDERIDLPYVPNMGEDLLFDRGLQFLATLLQGYLVEDPSA